MSLWDKGPGMVVHEREPYNAEPTRRELGQSEVTPVAVFYSRNHGPIPQVEPSDWRLQVGGLVDRPATLSLAELEDGFEYRQETATLQCAGNRRAGLIEVRDIPGEAPWGPGATSTATWGGVRLGDVLRAAGIRDEAAHVEMVGPDVSDLAEPAQVFGSSIVRSKALAPETLLAWEMNGAPLPRIHGGPVRVVVPGYIGARSVKWVEQITASAEPSDNYFQACAYRMLPAEADPSLAPPGVGFPLSAMAVNSDILCPDDGAGVPAGRLRVEGYALAGGDRKVARVDVSVDEGSSWVQAELHPPLSDWAWTLWHAHVEVAPGPVSIVARAWDTAAAVQPEDPRQVWNPKGYANNSWARIRVEAQ